jgi:hypothetical protein
MVENPFSTDWQSLVNARNVHGRGPLHMLRGMALLRPVVFLVTIFAGIYSRSRSRRYGTTRNIVILEADLRVTNFPINALIVRFFRLTFSFSDILTIV